ncbi:DnaA-binding chromosome replication initiation factor [Campylobacter pinnipediorum subsp. caledonicus]|uniref:DnaA-binding chromosome replication initiation factor n=1 Tax=Campylobacter pinnipediorum subsp. caledonicus TaxID=1874362 RepID=A0A1S6U8H4_9BACT|nr:HobA family DNA replication regulator [Campylobacter pinnipediorum]AQW86319.1 DnaA-binding chromosome replication initiation factor [Campylobacter pinnipediorum subsp. caledonicus]AQW87972.1 DnaA-binding chromosome replication initiation factor [Campylobacter pinnipediorum subsp. caledonicus]OPA71418.1 hypothetical protein BB381_02680 [Campylobacter pinnipediorum subsp. caledonicus]
MQEFMKWTLDAIRSEGLLLSWMEEKRVEWANLLAPRLKYLLNGRTFIVFTDDDREWFETYLLKKINSVNSARPLLPFVSLKSIYPSLDDISSKEQIMLLEDMLSIVFPNGYVYFYIGKSSDKKSQIAKLNDDSYMWLFDEQVQNSFYLSSSDDKLDTKLISLYNLLDKSIDATLFAELSL